jgi:hypothetical protein
MNQIAKNGERTGVGMLERERDRVADAEAHAEVLCVDDVHRRACYLHLR